MTIRRTIFGFSLLFLVAAIGCGQPQSTLNPGGPAGANLAQIGWVSYVVLGAAGLVTILLVLWAAVRRRGSLAEHEPYTAGGGQRWVLIGGFVIPFVVLCGLFVFAIDRMGQFPLHDGRHVRPEIQVIGHQWWWEVHYLEGGLSDQFVTANEIHIPVGRAVDLQLESADVIHSFWVPALHGKMELIPGQPNYLRVQADRPGNFLGQCGEYCGEQHAHMRILIVAQTPQDYEAWRRQQLQSATEPHDQEALHGRDVFNNGACALCHTVRGTVAQGKVAPDLTHIGSRLYIAANSYGNNTANLEAWVTHAQSMKPGALMPNVTEFSGADLRAMVTYLQQLK